MHALRMFAKRMVVCGVSIVGLSSGAAHGTTFLKFTGIKGDVTQKDHMNWTEVTDVSWGMTRTATSGAGAGKLAFQDVTWTQNVDQSIPPLFLEMTTGKPIATATVDFTKTCGDSSCTYFEMSFTNALLTSLSISGSGSEGAKANGAFAYTAVSMTYWGQKPDGTLGTPVSASYDLKTGKGSASALAGVFALGISGPGTVVPEPALGAPMLVALGLLGRHNQRRRRARAVADLPPQGVRS